MPFYIGGCLVGGGGSVKLQNIFNKTNLGWTNYGAAPVVYTTTKDYSVLIALARNGNGGHMVLTNYCESYGSAKVINMRTDDYFCYDANSGGLYNVAILTNVPKGTKIKAQANGSTSKNWLHVYAVE